MTCVMQDVSPCKSIVRIDKLDDGWMDTLGFYII